MNIFPFYCQEGSLTKIKLRWFVLFYNSKATKMFSSTFSCIFLSGVNSFEVGGLFVYSWKLIQRHHTLELKIPRKGINLLMMTSNIYIQKVSFFFLLCTTRFCIKILLADFLMVNGAVRCIY